MKWLLITTLGKNVGDEFARIGVQNLIREVDPGAEFDLVCKESPEINRPRPFDRAVVCGMPLFWSIQHNECQDIPWWKPVFRGWVSFVKRKFMVLGAGHVFVKEIFHFSRYCLAIEEVILRSWAVTVREPVISHPRIIDSVCPAAFATEARPGQIFKLCNLMPHGSHYYCIKTQADDLIAWKKKLHWTTEILRMSGFKFVAHDNEERRLATDYGWGAADIFQFGTPEEYLTLYSQAETYFGNRLHGAVVTASVGANTWAVAADSRRAMVERVGGYVCTPSKFSPPDLADWIAEGFPVLPAPWPNLSPERAKLVTLLREFASS